jgi:hypothetical protein
VTLLEAPEPPARLPSNSLSPESIARLVSAATVEATLAVELAVEPEVLPVRAAVPAALAAATVLAVEAAVEALNRPYRAEAWLLLLTLPIDIRLPVATAGIKVVDRDSQNFSARRHVAGAPHAGGDVPDGSGLDRRSGKYEVLKCSYGRAMPLRLSVSPGRPPEQCRVLPHPTKVSWTASSASARESRSRRAALTSFCRSIAMT